MRIVNARNSGTLGRVAQTSPGDACDPKAQFRVRSGDSAGILAALGGSLSVRSETAEMAALRARN